jgi:hypothetical protein
VETPKHHAPHRGRCAEPMGRKGARFFGDGYEAESVSAKLGASKSADEGDPA